MHKCKNISMKVLKDVRITVPKLRETRAVYMQKRQRMRAYNNSSMHNPKIKGIGRDYAFIIVAYPHPCLVAYITYFSNFWCCYPYIFQHWLMEMFYSCFTGFSLYT